MNKCVRVNQETRNNTSTGRNRCTVTIDHWFHCTTRVHSPHHHSFTPHPPRNRATRAARPAARRASSAVLRRARDSVPNRADPHVRTDTRADRPPRRSRSSRPSLALVVIATASTRGTTGNLASWWNTGSKTSGNDHDESVSCSALASASKHTRGAVSSGRGVRKVVATAWTSALAVVYRCSTVWCTHVPPTRRRRTHV